MKLFVFISLILAALWDVSGASGKSRDKAVDVMSDVRRSMMKDLGFDKSDAMPSNDVKSAGGRYGGRPDDEVTPGEPEGTPPTNRVRGFRGDMKRKVFLLVKKRCVAKNKGRR